MSRHLAPGGPHPGLQLRHQRRHLVSTHGQALLDGQAVNGPLGVEDRVNPSHRLGSERRFGELG
jgi:hypothetical protein